MLLLQLRLQLNVVLNAIDHSYFIFLCLVLYRLHTLLRSWQWCYWSRGEHQQDARKEKGVRGVRGDADGRRRQDRKQKFSPGHDVPTNDCSGISAWLSTDMLANRCQIQSLHFSPLTISTWLREMVHHTTMKLLRKSLIHIGGSQLVKSRLHVVDPFHHSTIMLMFMIRIVYL